MIKLFSEQKCGFGCELHHLVDCLILAYATERTFVLNATGWIYDKNGWENIFMPLSVTCLSTEGETRATWRNRNYNTQIVDVNPLLDNFNRTARSPQLPLAIPEEFATRFKRLNGIPGSFWVGQFLKYLLRLQPKTQEIIDDAIRRLNFQKPIVGVHIRRTDKVGTEAKRYEIEEYMKHVEEYYNQLEMIQKVEKRRVFLATDEPKVFIFK